MEKRACTRGCPEASVDFAFDDGNAEVTYHCCIHKLTMRQLAETMEEAGVVGNTIRVLEKNRKYWCTIIDNKDMEKKVLQVFPNAIVLGQKITVYFSDL